MNTKHLAFVFPGQGSQTLGMLADVAGEYPSVKVLFSQASEILGYDLWQLVSQGPVERLNQTLYTQPAMLTVDVAMWQVWQQKTSIVPSMVAGHSLGEIAACVVSGALNFADAVALVKVRAEYMQHAVAEGVGAMAAIIGLPDEQVADICMRASHDDESKVAPANFNAPGQIVVAGHTAAVDRAVILAKEAGSKMTKVLPVSVPSHCMLMKPAAEKLANYLANVQIKSPMIKLVNNVDVAVETDPDKIKDALVRQLYCPVRWIETIQFMAQQKIATIIECGAGKVLTSLNKRINGDLQLFTLNSLDSLNEISEL